MANMLLSSGAVDFLYRCDYENATHEERMGLIDLARKLYPNMDPGEEEK